MCVVFDDCSPVAVAIYDYEAMAEPGEEDNLEFEEGDIIEVSSDQDVCNTAYTLTGCPNC